MIRKKRDPVVLDEISLRKTAKIAILEAFFYKEFSSNSKKEKIKALQRFIEAGENITRLGKYSKRETKYPLEGITLLWSLYIKQKQEKMDEKTFCNLLKNEFYNRFKKTLSLGELKMLSNERIDRDIEGQGPQYKAFSRYGKLWNLEYRRMRTYWEELPEDKKDPKPPQKLRRKGIYSQKEKEKIKRILEDSLRDISSNIQNERKSILEYVLCHIFSYHPKIVFEISTYSENLRVKNLNERFMQAIQKK